VHDVSFSLTNTDRINRTPQDVPAINIYWHLPTPVFLTNDFLFSTSLAQALRTTAEHMVGTTIQAALQLGFVACCFIWLCRQAALAFAGAVGTFDSGFSLVKRCQMKLRTVTYWQQAGLLGLMVGRECLGPAHIGVDAQPSHTSPARGPPLRDDGDAQIAEGVAVNPNWATNWSGAAATRARLRGQSACQRVSE